MWVQRTEYGWQMLQIWRTGSKVRIYHDDGGYPGDGFHCSWGTMRGQKFTGKVQRVALDPIKVRYTIQRDGKKLRVLGLTGLKELDRQPWRRSSVQRFNAVVPESADNPGTWCRTFRPTTDQLNPAPGGLLVRIRPLTFHFFTTSAEPARHPATTSSATVTSSPASTRLASRTARLTGSTKHPDSESGNTDVRHTVVPMRACTFTDRNPPADRAHPRRPRSPR